MIGILLVTHRRLGEALVDTAAFILGDRPSAVEFVSIDLNQDADKMREKIENGIKKVDNRHGVLILTDMFGGTPSNISYSFLEEGRIEVISGVNLPILIKAVKAREDQELGRLAQTLETFGRQSISLASGILKGNKRN